MKKLIVMFALALAAVGVQAQGNMSIYAKIDGVKGECQDAKHQDWIELMSVSAGVHQILDPQRRRGSGQLDEVSLVKNVDKATCYLFAGSFQGAVFPFVEVQFCYHDGSQMKTFMAMTMKNVMITSHQVAANTGEAPLESLSLNYEECELTYYEEDHTGKVKDKHSVMVMKETAE